MNNYFTEIKNRLVLLILNGIFVTSTVYLYKESVLFILTYHSINISNQKLKIFYFIFTDIIEIWSVYVNIIFFLSNQIVFIYSIYNIFIFLIPAFYNKEYYYLKLIFKTITLFFLISITFFSYILFPISFNFFLSFEKITINNSFCLHFEAKIFEYLKFFVALYYGNVAYFQIFAFVFLIFSYGNFIRPVIIKKCRKLIYYFFFTLIYFVFTIELIIQLLIIFILTYEFLLFFFLVKFVAFYYRQRK